MNSKMDQSAPRHQCTNCLKIFTGCFYRDSSGCWFCEKCGPAMRPCRRICQGCSYRDWNKKTWKHEYLFCELYRRCGICKTYVGVLDLPKHVIKSHPNNTCMAGNRWTSTPVDEIIDDAFYLWSYCGPILVRYYLIGSLIHVNVLSGFKSNKLHTYRCFIELMDPKTGKVVSTKVKPNYCEVHDWSLKVDFNKFSNWSGLFTVFVDVQRK